MDAPSKLGKYDISGEISRGSMGIVYLAKDPYIGRDVAIKLAHADSLSDDISGPEFEKMFFNEAQAAGSLTHPNIISIYDAGVDGTSCYIVMELITGGKTLKEYCSYDNLLPLEKIIEIIFKCAKALDYAHRKGVIHRDIKPSNILIRENMEIQIADFSIAKVKEVDSSETQQESNIMGSPRYMSPEQLKGSKVGYQSDIFSLGVVMYEMLTGRHPFPGKKFADLIGKIMNEEPVPLNEVRTDLPDILSEIFTKATEKDPDNRYKTGMDFAVDLSKAFDILRRIEQGINQKDKINIVKKNPFFNDFPEGELYEIIRIGTWHQYSMKQDIIIQGEIDDCFYVIIKGQVGVVRNGAPIGLLGAGDCFGEMGFLVNSERMATVKALSETTLLRLNSTSMSGLTTSCQMRFMQMFLKALISRLSISTGGG